MKITAKNCMDVQNINMLRMEIIMEYGLIGEKLGHSYSKIIHEKLADYTYDLCPLSKTEFPVFMEKREFKAINVTIPYKEAVLPYLDEIDDRANAIGAVNTIVNKDGKLIGHNTDFGGFLYMLNAHGIQPTGKKCLILGSGGASKAVKAVLNYMNASSVLVVGRTAREGVLTYEQAYAKHRDASIIVNTTPVGMFPDVNATPVDLSRFPACKAAVDVIYNPSETLFTRQGKELGMTAVTGLEMLIAQAKYAVEFFLNTTIVENKIAEIYENWE